MKVIKFNKNIYNGLFLLAFSLFFILVTPFQVQLYEGSDALSPRLVPYFVLIILGILGATLIFNELKVYKNATSIDKTVQENDVDKDEKKSLRDLLIFIGMCLFIVFTAEILGFTFSAILVLIATLKIFHVKNIYLLLVVGIGVPIIIDVIFRLLEIYLPLGIWEGIIY